MPVIAQRTLRNEISDILRRTSQGETFTITVNGKPVAELRPLDDVLRRATLNEILDRNPIDESWAREFWEMRRQDRASASS